MSQTHRLVIGNLVRELDIRPVPSGAKVAYFNIQEDPEMAYVAAVELAKRLPKGVEALVMPDGKAVPLLHFVGLMTRLPIVVALKKKKPTMLEPIIETTDDYASITNGALKLFLDAESSAKLRGKKYVFLDDVISQGGSVKATMNLADQLGAVCLAKMCIATEGEPRSDVISLAHLPLY